jgi:hypothetical protein
VRLINAVKRLEAGAARAREEVAPGVGLVWSKDEVSVDPLTLEDGEYVAVDVVMEGGGPSPLGGTAPVWWTVTERVTLDPRDLGVVRNVAGERIGLVTDLDGSMVTWRADEIPQLGRGSDR